MTGVVDPIYVSCHMCHASVGQPCKEWARASLEEGTRYCRRRVSAAQSYPRPGINAIDTEHALAHGASCVGHSSGGPGWEDLCVKCGQRISRLRDIPALSRQE